MKKMCSFDLKCPVSKPTYIPEEWEVAMTNKEKLNGLLAQVAELLKDDDVYPVEPFGYSVVVNGLTIIPTDQFKALNADRLDTKRLDWLLLRLAFLKYDQEHDGGYVPYISIDPEDIDRLGERLSDALFEMDMGDPRQIIDKAMEDDKPPTA